MKKVVTEFDAEKQSLRMYFQGLDTGERVEIVLLAVVALGMLAAVVGLVNNLLTDILDYGTVTANWESLAGLAIFGGGVAVLLWDIRRKMRKVKHGGVLDRDGFRTVEWLRGLEVDVDQSAALADVMDFQVAWPELDAGCRVLHVAVRMQEADVRKSLRECGINLLLEINMADAHQQRLERVAAECNALLEMLKAGVRVSETELKALAEEKLQAQRAVAQRLAENPAESVTLDEESVAAEKIPRFTPRVARPEACRWEADSDSEGLIFQRHECFSAEMAGASFLIGCAFAVLTWLAPAYLKWEGITEKPFGMVFYWMAIIFFGVGAFGLFRATVTEMRKYRRRAGVHVSRRALREGMYDGSPQWQCTHSLDGLARITVEHRSRAAKLPEPWVAGEGEIPLTEEFYALIFENADGESLAEITDLTQDEARWMRDEILRNF